MRIVVSLLAAACFLAGAEASATSGRASAPKPSHQAVHPTSADLPVEQHTGAAMRTAAKQLSPITPLGPRHRGNGP